MWRTMWRTVMGACDVVRHVMRHVVRWSAGFLGVGGVGWGGGDGPMYGREMGGRWS
jgi:hypothetical protein